MVALDTLPAEVRLNIFKHLLPASSITYVGATQDGAFAVEDTKGKARGIWPSMGNVTKVLRTCSLFDKELSPLIYRNKIFYIRNAPDSLTQAAAILKHLRPETLQLIKGAIMNYQIANFAQVSHDCNWSVIKEHDHGEVTEKASLVQAKLAFCRAAANKLNFLSLRIETRNCQWLTAATLSAKAEWLEPFLTIPGISARFLSIESPRLPREPENETREDFKKRLEDQLYVQGLNVRVVPPGGMYCKLLPLIHLPFSSSHSSKIKIRVLDVPFLETMHFKR